MTVIGLLTYHDFLAQLERDGQTKPIRLQAHRRDSESGPPQRAAQHTFFVELATETLDEDIIICRFITAQITSTTIIPPAKLKRFQALNERAADLLKQDLVANGFSVDPGLVQLNQTVTIVTAWPDCWANLTVPETPSPPLEGIEGGPEQ